jgi:hypothetical protein
MTVSRSALSKLRTMFRAAAGRRRRAGGGEWPGRDVGGVAGARPGGARRAGRAGGLGQDEARRERAAGGGGRARRRSQGGSPTPDTDPRSGSAGLGGRRAHPASTLARATHGDGGARLLLRRIASSPAGATWSRLAAEATQRRRKETRRRAGHPPGGGGWPRRRRSPALPEHSRGRRRPAAEGARAGLEGSCRRTSTFPPAARTTGRSRSSARCPGDRVAWR